MRSLFEAPFGYSNVCPLKIFKAKMSLRRVRRKEEKYDHDLHSPLETLNRASRITLYLPLCGLKPVR